MRKTSQDGGDSTSITSGIENEIKKPGAIGKTKRNSIKRKVQNFSHESDDAVIEPLLQKDKEKPETTKPSAKFNLLSKTKTDDLSEKGTDKDKLITDDKLQKSGISNASEITDKISSSSNSKENNIPKITSANAPLHNHMNTNVFGSPDGLKGFVAPKSQILVEIDGCKQVGYNPSPLIFTTAKIHTDGKTKHMEPVQVTPVPILSTIEVSVLKSGGNASEKSGQVSSNISTVYAIPHTSKNIIEPTYKAVNNVPTTQNKAVIDIKIPSIMSTELDKTSKILSSSKETKPTQSKISPTGIPDNTMGNKNLTKENKSEKDEKHIKPPISQVGNYIDAKVTSSSVATTKSVPTNNSMKDSGAFDKTKDKLESHRQPEHKIELTKTAKLDSTDSQKIQQRDDIKTSKDKNREASNTSTSSRQLQRQGIVEKEDTISNIKPTNDLKSTNKAVDSQKNKSADSQKSSKIETSDKTKLPKPSANSIPVTNVTINNTTPNTAPNLATNVSKNVSANKSSIPTTITSSVAKSPIPTTKNLSEGKSPATTTTTSPAVKISTPTTTPFTTSKTIVSTMNPSNATTSTVSKNMSTPVSTTAPVKKTSIPVTTAPVTNKTSVPASVTVASSKVTAPSTTKTDNKSAAISTTITNAPSNKTSQSITTSGVNKGHSPSVTTSTVKMTSGPHTTTPVDKTTTSNSISSAKSIASSITSAKPLATTTSSVPKTLNTEKPSITASSVNIKPEVTKASFNAKSQESSIQSKPTSSINTTKPSKVSSAITPATTSQRIDTTKSQNTITTAKPTSSKAIPQTIVGKSTDAPKSSTSNEKPSSVKSSGTSISSATTSGVSNVNVTAAATSPPLASTGSSSKTTEGNKQNDSKSKELSNGSKSLKA